MPCEPPVTIFAVIALIIVYRNLRPAMDSKTYSSIISLYKSVPLMFPPQIQHINSHVDAFLHSDSPPPVLPPHEFVPMFTRVGRLDGAQTFDTLKSSHPSIPNGLSDLPSMLPELEAVDGEDNSIYKQHMIVVDGWRKFLVSISSERLYICHFYRDVCTILSLKHQYPIARL
jgi:hypothetical protein